MIRNLLWEPECSRDIASRRIRRHTRARRWRCRMLAFQDCQACRRCRKHRTETATIRCLKWSLGIKSPCRLCKKTSNTSIKIAKLQTRVPTKIQTDWRRSRSTLKRTIEHLESYDSIYIHFRQTKGYYKNVSEVLTVHIIRNEQRSAKAF